ncbi:hypothetical protein ALT785_580132 [Alteromonas infernus]
MMTTVRKCPVCLKRKQMLYVYDPICFISDQIHSVTDVKKCLSYSR